VTDAKHNAGATYVTATHETMVARARDICETVLKPAAWANDRDGRFSTEAVEALGNAGLLALSLPAELGGAALGPRAFADVMTILAEADASVAMVYLMHTLAAATIAAATCNDVFDRTLREIGAGRHLSTLAFSEAGSRSHFWAPVSRAQADGSGVALSAKKSFVTSAGFAHSYVVSALAPTAISPTESTLYLVPRDAPGLSVSGRWDGLGLRANASAPMLLEDCAIAATHQLTDDGAGFAAMLNIVLPLFNLGSACVALGLCRAAVAAVTTHLKAARFEHLGQSLGEALPTLRALLAGMVIDTDGLAARIDDLVDHLERQRDTTMLRVLETKAAAGEIAIGVTSAAMRAAGGAAFSRNTSIDRLFRDAHAGAVMAPTSDTLRDFIGKAVLGMELF
jgi:alkylation response protein AidB-like acyl-CoA dehydrogenase